MEWKAFGRGPTLPDHRKEKQTLGKWWVKETGKTLWYNSFFQFPSKFPIECKACSNCYILFLLPGKKKPAFELDPSPPAVCFPWQKGHFGVKKKTPFPLRHINQRQEELPACLPGGWLRWNVNPLGLDRSPPWSIRPLPIQLPTSKCLEGFSPDTPLNIKLLYFWLVEKKCGKNPDWT